MTLMKRELLALSIGILACGSVSFVLADDSQNWKIEADNTGIITRMTYPDPKTPLGIEKDLTINISPSGKALSGKVDFLKSYYYGVVQRDMTAGEVSTYFSMFSGPKAEWDYYQAQNKLVTVTPEGKIPAEWLGKQARVITNTGKHIIGKLEASGTEGEWQVEVDGACCGAIHFTMAGVKQVQELKGTR
jgi:hypothetical protein